MSRSGWPRNSRPPPGELLARHEERAERLHRGPREGARGPRAPGRRRTARLRGRDRQVHQYRGADRLHQVRGAEDPAPVEAVGDVAARKREQRDRKEDGEPGVAERQRIAGQVVQDTSRSPPTASAAPGRRRSGRRGRDGSRGLLLRDLRRLDDLAPALRLADEELAQLLRACSARGSTPSSAKRFCTSGAASAFASSWCTRSMTARGVFAGAASAFQEATS